MIASSYTVAWETSSNNVTSNISELQRTGRKNYGPFSPLPPRDYGAIGDDEDDSSDESEPLPYNDKPQQGSVNPSYNKYKGYDQFSNYGPPSYPPFVNNYKGYPFAGVPPMSPDQMLQMMMALKSMKENEGPEDTGIISKLFSDSKTAAAAFIPLSIAAAAFVPVLMNYFTGGLSTPTVSTIANSKQFRNLDVSNNLDVLLESIISFSRAMDSDECIQKTICKAASAQYNLRVSEYVKKIASTIAQVVKDDYLINFRIKHLVDAVKQGNCNNVCNDTGNVSLL
ncbi:uncharacterized protein NPIL_459241 [Nephila pilipes]|uniref:Uncharacterized protein n=1 Tax=Nephila pilipes TaxID=299642 RepID=A0A8X6UMX8_NEPPI|nr:uncharacterized protein NPIL_459241 [Nephila pilipes]